MSDKLDRAIELFEDENSDLTLGERVNELRKALLWNAFAAFKKIKKYGIKDKRSQDEDYKQIECMRQFKIIEKMYDSQIKTNRLEGRRDEDFKNDFLKQIKEQKSSVGDIVGSTNITSKNTHVNGKQLL